MKTGIFITSRLHEEEDSASFDFQPTQKMVSRDDMSIGESWPEYKDIPVIKQQCIPNTDIVREYETKRWYKYLKDAGVFFIWVCFLGILAFAITVWSVTADGSKSFLMDHFPIALVCVLLISIAFSLVITVSMIWCRQRCGSFVLASDQEAERVVITRHSSQSDITDAFDPENPAQRNINRTMSRIGTSLFQEDDNNSYINGTMCNIYNVQNGYSKITRLDSIGSFVPYQSPEAFKRIGSAVCCAAEPQRTI